MRLRRQHRAPEAEGPGASDPQEDASERRTIEQPGIGAVARSGEIADGALTRERHFVEGTHPLDEDAGSAPAKTGGRHEGWRRRTRASAAESDGLDPEVFSRLSKYRLTAELLERQKSRGGADDDEPWRKE